MRALAVLVLACSIGATLVAQQTPPRDTTRPSAGTASVAARVTDRDTGQPLRRIRIQLSGRMGDAVSSFDAETDADGRYVFAEIPAGEYSAYAGPGEFRADYQSHAFGFKEDVSAFGRPPPLDLKAGEIRRDVDF